jgi:hypothetical protein
MDAIFAPYHSFLRFAISGLMNHPADIYAQIAPGFDDKYLPDLGRELTHYLQGNLLA